ncbi:phage major tail tube protein [Aquamicrobium sp.]|uniref:phage major tail tube protein n=1 Tax=Aquamicrobium sp. TaxID=1872579 RepID=UPI00258E6F4A|nr:phage major tail tube protein [Aquamicrobium sp.]MCK9549640.1 phage major tail tube protein [Aquamicrobium sp.]
MKQTGRYFSAFIDGKGKFAELATVKEPDLKWVREGYAGGGMVGEVEPALILEALKGEMTLYNYDQDAINIFGLVPGMPQPFQFRRELFDTRDQGSESVVIHMHASVDLEFPEWGRKSLEGVKLPLFIHTYRRFLNGVEQYHIDPEGMIFRVNGNDALVEARRAIGR